MLSIDQQKEILSKFLDKVPGYKCPICQGRNFKFMNGFIMMPLQNSPEDYSLKTGQGLPCISVVCEKCGNVSFFSTISLGLSDADV